MKRRPTITDVAARAGVSKSTVSLVLQGSPLVRSETAKSVRAAMREIGYVYNRAAATLRGSSVGLVGLVIKRPAQPVLHGIRGLLPDGDGRCRIRDGDIERRRGRGASGKTGRLDDRARCRRGGDQPGLWRSFLGVRPIGAGRYSDPAGAAPDGPAHGAVSLRELRLRRRQRRGHAAPDRQRRAAHRLRRRARRTLDHAGADGGLPRRAGGGGPVAAPGRGSDLARLRPKRRRPIEGRTIRSAMPCSVSTILLRWG